MSEYWVSHKKYFCKYCDIYITDDAPSRRQHETGLRHKGNRERFVRNLYKQGERRKKDLEEEKREMARVEAVGCSLGIDLFDDADCSLGGQRSIREGYLCWTRVDFIFVFIPDNRSGFCCGFQKARTTGVRMVELHNRPISGYHRPR